jgi:hypothetical protein
MTAIHFATFLRLMTIGVIKFYSLGLDCSKAYYKMTEMYFHSFASLLCYLLTNSNNAKLRTTHINHYYHMRALIEALAKEMSTAMEISKQSLMFQIPVHQCPKGLFNPCHICGKYLEIPMLDQYLYALSEHVKIKTNSKIDILSCSPKIKYSILENQVNIYYMILSKTYYKLAPHHSTKAKCKKIFSNHSENFRLEMNEIANKILKELKKRAK